MLSLLYIFATGATVVVGQAPIGGQANQGITSSPRDGPEAWFYSSDVCDGDSYSSGFQIETYENDNCRSINADRISLWVTNDPDMEASPIKGCLYAFGGGSCDSSALTAINLDFSGDTDRSKTICLNFWDKNDGKYTNYKLTTTQCQEDKFGSVEVLDPVKVTVKE